MRVGFKPHCANPFIPLHDRPEFFLEDRKDAGFRVKLGLEEFPHLYPHVGPHIKVDMVATIQQGLALFSS